MNYKKIYDTIILRARNRNLTSYTESHHIIPRCMGGLDYKTNLVNLTPEEHFVAHQLLVKLYPGNHGIIKAANMMTLSNEYHKKRNNKLYGWLRKRLSETMSVSQTGSGNSQFGRYWICELSTGDTDRITDLTKIPNGWIRGKKLPSNSKCSKCGNDTACPIRKFCNDHRKELFRQNALRLPQTIESKLSRSKTRSANNHQQGDKNSQYSTRWVNDGTIVKKIKKIDIPNLTSEWRLGRKI